MTAGDFATLIGPRRMMMFLCVLGVFAALIAFYYAYLLPQIDKMETDYYKVRQDISAIEDVIGGHRTAFEAFSDRRTPYDEIVKDGFLKPQRRLELAQTFADLQENLGLLNLRYDILPAQMEESEQAQEINHRLMRTDMTIEVDAFLDQDIVNFVKALKDKLPGHVRISSLSLTRRGPLDQQALEQISEGNKPLLVQAEMRARWHSLVANEDLPDADGQEAGLE